MQISRNIVNGPKSNNLVGIWIIICIQEPSHHFLQTCRPLRRFRIVFHDISLHLKQFCLFCLLRLISASADRFSYITKFCSMSSKTAVVNTEAFRHVMFQQGKRKTKSLLDLYT